MNPSDPVEAPPNRHKFHRPWSPNSSRPYVPPHGLANDHDNVEFNHYDQRQHAYLDLNRTLSGHQRRSREPSDVSVEALDLADFAHSFPRLRQFDDLRIGPTIHPQDLYTRFPRSSPPRSTSSTGSKQVPSLVSRGNTPSSSSAHSGRRPIRRPYSVPDTARIQSTGSTQLSQGHGVDNAILPESEIDIAQFPRWSRGWYQSTGKNKQTDYDLEAPPPARLSMFDPSFKPKPTYDNDFYSLPYNGDIFPPHSSHHGSSREYYLPWSSDPLENGIPVNPETKEERMRMLEREFGRKAKPDPHDAFTDENGKPLIGTVDAKGYIVTEGPKKRAAVRALQIVLGLVAAIPSIYAALLIKPVEGTPPPAGKPAAFVLYVLSVITTLAMLYLHVLIQCCGSRKGKKALGNGPILNGMMVLPVQGLQGRKNKQKGKKGRKTGEGDVQVNLIVDPNAFGIDGKDGRDDDEDDEGWGSDGDTHASSSRRNRRKSPRRRSFFVGQAMEKEWKRARAWLKKMALVDGVGLVLWGGAFILILIGSRCPSGGYDGWCNAYNTSSAAACLLCVAFGFSIFFDIKDLYASKANPRTRT